MGSWLTSPNKAKLDIKIMHTLNIMQQFTHCLGSKEDNYVAQLFTEDATSHLVIQHLRSPFSFSFLLLVSSRTKCHMNLVLPT